MTKAVRKMGSGLAGLRALTLRPEFAEMVVNGSEGLPLKRIENRSWRGRLGERIALHRGGRNGGIFALATVIEMLTVREARRKYPDQREYIGGPVCWVLDDVQTFTPVECRGQLSLWRVSDEILSQIERRLYDGEGKDPCEEGSEVGEVQEGCQADPQAQGLD